MYYLWFKIFDQNRNKINLWQKPMRAHVRLHFLITLEEITTEQRYLADLAFWVFCTSKPHYIAVIASGVMRKWGITPQSVRASHN